MDLVSIHSAERNAAVMAVVSSGSPWIGLSDSSSEGSFDWSDGSGVDYTNWSTGEPNDLDDEDGAHLWDIAHLTFGGSGMTRRAQVHTP